MLPLLLILELAGLLLPGGINVLSGPSTAFSGTPLEACQPPLRVSFSNETTNGTVHRWLFGEGTRSPGQNPQFVYNEYGSYTVTLITIGSNGCYDTLVKPDYVKVIPPNITGIPGLPYEGCFPWTKTLSPNITTLAPIVKWEWDFGDGRTSTEATPTITFTERGEYKIKLKVTTESGCVDSIESKVRGGYKPKVDFTASPLTVCTMGEVSFLGTVAGIYDKIEWTFGDGSRAFDLLEPINPYKDTGYMDVTLYAYDHGCFDSLVREKYIYVIPPYANFGVDFNCSNLYERRFTDSSVGASIWIWDFGNGDSSNIPSPVYTYPEPGKYQASLTVIDGECMHKKSVEVNIYDEKPDFTVEGLSSCGDNVVTFTAKGPNLNLDNLSLLTWRFSDNVNFVNAGPVIQRRFTQNTKVDLRLNIEDLNGCKNYIVKPVSISIDGPKARITPAFTMACAGSTVSFPDASEQNPLNPIVKYTWNFGNGPDVAFSAPPFETTYPDTGYYNLKLKVEDANGCADSISIIRGVGIFSPVASFSSPDTIVCPNTDVNFYNASTGVGLKYNWSFGDGGNSSQRQPVKQYPKDGLYDIKLEVTDTANCTSIMERPQYINVGGLKSSFAVSDTFASCPPLRVIFTNASVGGIQNLWDFGNGNTSLLSDPIQTYTEIGVFNARLIITGKGGCKDTMTTRINVSGPQGTITYGPLSGCPPLEVKFSSNTTNVKNYIWDFSDGITEFTTDSAVTHTYINPGTYRPRVILEDGQNCKISIIGDEDVKVVGVRSIIDELDSYVHCDAATISFIDSSLTNDVITKWRWDFGNGDTSNLPNPEYTYTEPGRYNVSLFVETSDKCISFAALPGEVVIAPSPIMEIGADTLFCIPEKINMSSRWVNPDTTVINYQWDFGNGVTSTLQNPGLIAYATPGNYTTRMLAIDNYGCRDTLTRNIVAKDTPNIKVAGNLITCRESGTELRASGAEQFRWDAHATLSCIDCSNPIASPLEDRTYLVTGNNGPGAGCARTKEVTVRVIQPLEALASAGDTLCIGDAYQIIATGADRYTWSPSAGLSATNISNPIARPQQTTNYRLIASDSLNCFRDTVYVPVVVYPKPVVKIVQDKISGIVGSRAIIQTESSDVTRWRWTPATGLSCVNCPQPEVVISQSSSYRVMGTNPGGCIATDEVEIEPICTADGIFVPNTFSPNGDGRNDVFYPMGKGVASIKSLKVFNRWGEVMFERTNLNANDPSAGWDGTYKGKELTADVYVYIMVVLCFNNEILDIKGNVTLLK
jgi:gliding motility-associated-like protein